MAMSHIYEKDMPSIQKYMKHFKLIDCQMGEFFMINGKVVGMECFGKAESFSKIFKKLVESYALDAIDWFDSEKEEKTVKSEVTKFIETSRAAEVESHPAVGMGVDLRMNSKNITGFALSYDDRILHLSIFSKSDGQNRKIPISRMESYSQRRRNRIYQPE
jgi:hypothetical protein